MFFFLPKHVRTKNRKKRNFERIETNTQKTTKNWLLNECVQINIYLYQFMVFFCTKNTIAESIRQDSVFEEISREKQETHLKKTMFLTMKMKLKIIQKWRYWWLKFSNDIVILSNCATGWCTIWTWTATVPCTRLCSTSRWSWSSWCKVSMNF